MTGDRCKHYCRDCLCHHIRTGRTSCKVCDTLYDLNFFANQYNHCKGCKTNVHYVGDYLISICNQDYHPLCFKCSEIAVNIKQCTVCKSDLNEESLNKLNYVLYSKCKRCDIQNERGYFTMKTCCEDSICLACQIISPNCRLCGLELNEETRNVLEILKHQYN